MRICDCLTSMFCLAEALAWVTQIMEVGMGQAGHRCGRAWMISLGIAPIELLGSGARLMGRTANPAPPIPGRPMLGKPRSVPAAGFSSFVRPSQAGRMPRHISHLGLLDR
jgi:hypothetical protein